jgi:cation diffusion facilitator CzcD-associated flavoprotein CzcO
VLATGIDGSGRWEIPALVSDNLSPALFAHTRDDIDFAALKGKKIGVLGAGASAFDNASVALEAGAAEVHLFFRRETLPSVNPYRWAEFTGFLRHHGDMPDDQRWRFVRQIVRMGQLPPTDTYQRAMQHPNFRLQPGSPWEQVAEVDGKARVTTPKGVYDLDFLLIGTGFVTDLSLRPELANLHDKIALWSDRYTPPPEEASADLARHPYLGAGFECQEKQPGETPWIRGIFNYTFGGLVSLGFGGASISGMKYSLPRIVGGITRQLYEDDLEAHYQGLVHWSVEEFER